MSPKSASLAEKAGYKKIRVFLAGVPAWNKAGLPLEVKAPWLASNLGQHVVVVDVRGQGEAAKARIRGAVVLSHQELAQMRQSFESQDLPLSKQTLLGLSDKTAPVILVGQASLDKAALAALGELQAMGYKKVTLLAGGQPAALAAKLPQEQGVIKNQLSYEKKKRPGAVSSSEFAQLLSQGKAQVVDVREPEEAAGGKIKGALSLPLSQLEQGVKGLDKSKLLVTHCVTGVRAEIAYQKLKAMGFQVAYLDQAIVVDAQGAYRFP